MAVEHPTWSPDGNILSFTTRSTNRGVWITPVDGSYVNLVSTKSAVQSWSPDGSWLILATLSGSDLGYNGDPNRLGNAQDREELISDGRLWVARAPSLPETGLVEVPVVAEMSRTARNAESFDRLWDRMDQLY